VISEQQSIKLFVELIKPSIQLVVMGSNYDIYPLLRQANDLDWQTVVVANPKKLDKLAFKFADVVDDFNKVNIDAYTAAIIMSHNYPKDKSNLEKALDSDLQYIGLLGPATRRDDLLEDLGLNSTDSDLNRLYGPAGLDIGANQPEEIANSIIAEIIAVMRNRDGQSLKNRNAPINPR
ncbi:MAG: XdhC family protein, partial [Bacteroidota bacterium]